LTLGPSIALPPLIHFGNAYQKSQIVPRILAGHSSIALAITEPYAGSDVASLTATARRVGREFVVSGEKKWITNGCWAEYFVVAVRTGGDGMKGISLLLIQRGSEGFSVRPVACQGNRCSGTAFLVFDRVRVPVENLIGEENEGFKCIMSMFFFIFLFIYH
jgi:alkylation response protein AidB-like acyl-CoA dehydrogenase